MFVSHHVSQGYEVVLIFLVTGVFLAEAVRTILKDQHDLSGGVYTPACLGQKFIDRLDDAGFKFERKFYDN